MNELEIRKLREVVENLLVEQAELRHEISRVRSECVGLRVVHHIDTRHRQGRLCRQLLHDLIKLRRAPRIDLARMVHGERHLVGIPVGEEVQPGGEQEREDHAA